MGSKIRFFLKALFGIVFYYTGAFYLIRAWNNLSGKRLTIVTYHRVTDKNIDEISSSLPYLFVTESTFRKHLEFFKKHYRIINFNDLSIHEVDPDIPRNSLIVTFDDGYEDNLTKAFPILCEYDVPWTIFLATEKIGSNDICWWDRLYALLTDLRKKEQEGKFEIHDKNILKVFCRFKKNPSDLFAQFNTWKIERIETLINSMKIYSNISDDHLLAANRFLSWDHVIKMGDTVGIGSHACSHMSLNSLMPEQVMIEIVESKKIIEENCGKEVTVFSYPAGQYRQNIKSTVAKSGYSFAVSQEKGVNNLSDPYSLKRINLWEGSATLHGKFFSKGFLAFKLLGF